VRGRSNAAVDLRERDTAPAAPRARGGKAEQVYAALKDAIVAGELSPAASIDKLELCERFGVSRFPVTTALNRLAYERLVVVEPQRGTYVAKIELGDVREWMMARRALEAEIAGECARHLAAPALDRVARNLRYQQAAVDGGDLDGFHELDVAFHRLLIEELGLSRVGDMLESIRVHLDRVRRMLLPEPGRMRTTLAEHKAVYAAIRRRDPAAAGEAMRAHVDVVLGQLLDFEKRHPEFFLA
jgi:GntR family transcriptional regulator, rspAB operon transcriptional repressor